MIVLAKQTYGRGETPVYLAYIDNGSGEPVNPADYTGISMTHGQYVMSFSGRVLVPMPGLEDYPITLAAILAEPVESATAFEGTNTEPFAYNFIFMPGVFGTDFYPEPDTYRTVFELHRADGGVDVLTFESVCVTKFSGRTINFGEIPTFTASVRTKQIQDDGSVLYVQGFVSRIVRTVLRAGETISDTQIPLAQLTEDPDGNFVHTPDTNIFPAAGEYVVRFTFYHADGSPVGVAEMTVRVD